MHNRMAKAMAKRKGRIQFETLHMRSRDETRPQRPSGYESAQRIELLLRFKSQPLLCAHFHAESVSLGRHEHATLRCHRAAAMS